MRWNMASNQNLILVIDLGTSGPKVGLADEGARLLGHEFEPTPVQYYPGGGAEQKTDDWWNAIVTASLRLWLRFPDAQKNVRAVCCTAQWSGTVPVGEDGA